MSIGSFRSFGNGNTLYERVTDVVITMGCEKQPIVVKPDNIDGITEFLASHRCTSIPVSSDFQNGCDAEGCVIHESSHFQQVVGGSGVYLIETDLRSGQVVRDDRPWQVRV